MKSQATRSTFDKLMPIMQEGDFAKAVALWCLIQQERGICRDGCPYGVRAEFTRCAICLEGRLRATSLASSANDEDCAYQWAANAINDWLTLNAPLDHAELSLPNTSTQ